MSRPQSEPTHWQPLWLESACAADASGVCHAHVYDFDNLGIIPAERVTVAPEPYTPKAGDRVATDLGYEATLLTDQPLQGRLAVRFHIPNATDRYTTIDPAMIQGPA